MVTANDMRMNIFLRGTIITEKVHISAIYQQEVVAITMTKNEPDGIGYIVAREIATGLYGKEQYVDLLREMAGFIDKCVYDRNNNNPNICNHQIVIANGHILCSKCIAKLGDHFELNLRRN